MDALTLRQQQVLYRIKQGKTNKEIGKELQLAEKTVKAHVTRVLRVLKVRNRTEAAVAVLTEVR